MRATDRAMRRREFLASGSGALVAAAFTRTAAFAALPPGQELSDRILGVRAMTFDVFGTVVDWRTSITREGEAVGREKGIEADWAAFADDWRAGYGPAMGRVRRGELGWTKIDVLHRMILDELVPKYGLESLTEEELDDLNRAWHRLTPWPDTVEGLTRLKKRYVLASLSNGNVALLVNMAKNAGIPWDAVLSAELARHYKPDPEAYLTAADLLGRVSIILLRRRGLLELDEGRGQERAVISLHATILDVLSLASGTDRHTYTRTHRRK